MEKMERVDEADEEGFHGSGIGVGAHGHEMEEERKMQ
jgi:hypothetical protein